MVRSTSGDPAATIEDLPQELIDRFCMFADVPTLKSLRLTSKNCESAATRSLFSHVEVLPTEDSSNKCLELMSSPRLSILVKNLAFHTAIDPASDNEDGEHNHRDSMYDGLIEGDDYEYFLPSPCYDVLSGLAAFQELQHVSLTFSEHVHGDSLDFASSARESMEFRDGVMIHLLRSFIDPKSLQKFHQISLKNLQDSLHPSIKKGPKLKKLLSRLDSLSLQIATETHDAAPELEIEMDERHEIFNTTLKKHFLTPIAANLHELKLFTTTGLNTHVYWGEYPQCDLRDVHFPKLQILGLGNFGFAYEWQLKWILSHADTLRTLVLDDCPIVIAGKTSQDMEHAHIIPDTGGEEKDDEETFWTFDARWHTYLTRIKNELPNLTHFGMSCEMRGKDLENIHDAFSIYEVGAELSVHRYRVFNGGSLWDAATPYTTFSKDVDGDGKKPEFELGWDEDEDDGDKVVEFPNCWKEDQEALRELLDAVASRR
ncbi:hypothetical protein AC579_8167 [Pseudocercospora musae]|uniref:F-box domain-containing protein n=1 Tax=Pseudocercospora musae TaxID=113226 RepID=A0A139IUE0_9PEZI|nr:hypothetical protein AC579_8167 [Pseudocercospora musae]